MTSREPNWTYGQGSELMLKLIKAGMQPSEAQALIENGELLNQWLAALPNRAKSTVLTTTWARAAKIMGKKAIGIEVASKLGINLSKSQIAQYGLVPCDEGQLEEARDSDLTLAAMPKLSQVQLRERAAPRYLYPNEWYLRKEEREAFSAINFSELGYYFIGELPNSSDMVWADQEKAVQAIGFQVPFVVELAYAAVGYLALGHGELFSNYLRCRDVDSAGRRCGFGVGGGQVYVNRYWDSDRGSRLGGARRQFLGLAF